MTDLNYRANDFADTTKSLNNSTDTRALLIADLSFTPSKLDQQANYSESTLQALHSFEQGNFNGLQIFYRNADDTSKTQVEQALKSSGIEIAMDGNNVKLSMKDPKNAGEERNLLIGQFGSLTPELVTNDANLKRMFDGLTLKQQQQIWMDSFKEKFSLRPQMRSA